MDPGSLFVGFVALALTMVFIWHRLRSTNLKATSEQVMVVSKFVEIPTERFLSSVPMFSAFCMDFHWYESQILDDPLPDEPVYCLQVQAQSGDNSRQFCFAVTQEQYNAAELWHYIENPFCRRQKGRQHQPAAA